MVINVQVSILVLVFCISYIDDFKILVININSFKYNNF